MKKRPHLVFAYGSNMNRRQMADRCPGAEPFCVARLRGHRLVFTGSSARWGGGVATIRPHAGSSVIGIVWQLTTADLEKLDVFEGFPWVYDRVRISVFSEDAEAQEILCSTYVREPKVETLPSEAYLRTIIDGYEWAGLRAPRRLQSMLQGASHA